jgi:hypothetical protein
MVVYTTSDTYFEIKNDMKEKIVFLTKIHNNVDCVQTVIKQEMLSNMNGAVTTKSLEFNLN